MAKDVQQRKSGAIRPAHTLTLVVVGVIGVVVGFWVLSSIAGVLWGFVKVVVILAVLAGLAWMLLGRRRR
jgi:uncharacterized protein (DUF983 family)